MLKMMRPGQYFEQILRLGLEVLKLKLPGLYLNYFRTWAWNDQIKASKAIFELFLGLGL